MWANIQHIKKYKCYLKVFLANFCWTSGLIAISRYMLFFFRLPIFLVYHRVDSEKNGDYGALNQLNITPDQFEKHLLYLKRFYRIINLIELERMLGANELENNMLSITFDDGYEDNYKHAFQILRKQNLTASFFITTSIINTKNILWTDKINNMIISTQKSKIDIDVPGSEINRYKLQNRSQRINFTKRIIQKLKTLPDEERKLFIAKLVNVMKNSKFKNDNTRYMNWNQIKEMNQAGMVFGCHTHTHPILSKINMQRLDEEIKLSKTKLELELGIPCRYFAYPNGQKNDYDEKVIDSLKSHGFTLAFSTIPGAFINLENRFEIPRISIDASDGREVLAFKIVFNQMKSLFKLKFSIQKVKNFKNNIWKGLNLL